MAVSGLPDGLVLESSKFTLSGISISIPLINNTVHNGVKERVLELLDSTLLASDYQFVHWKVASVSRMKDALKV